VIPWWGLIALVFGANITLWGGLGLCRLVEHRFTRRRRGPVVDEVVALHDNAAGRPPRAGGLTVDDVAVLIAAHNESVVIEDSLDAIKRLVPMSNIHVVSDGSTDDTMELAAGAGVRVMATESNVGKAGALSAAIREFGLVERFAVVMLLDADTRVQPDYFTSALPLFDDPEVAAVAGCVRTARDRRLSVIGNVLVGHRMRIYAIAQRVLKFGQTWSRVNATYIVPGFASMYRTDVLPKIDINPPGLVIEDFNMTFELYQKRLGKVGFTLGGAAVTQDPDTVRDYVRQTKRWALGLWQTVRRHPPKLNLFSTMLTLVLVELITSSLMFLLLPLLILVLVVPDLYGSVLALPAFADVHAVVAAHVNLRSLLLGIVVPDYAMTLVVAVIERRPRLVLCGLAFPFLRVLDAGVALYALPLAWLAKSNGRWKSPARRALPAGDVQDGHAAADQPIVTSRARTAGHVEVFS
jgi:poly-beta-1,6-N-acetyl-D-glucosamine synthase